MNTDRSSSMHTRRLQARYIATYNNNAMIANNNGILTHKYIASNRDASLMNYIDLGNLDRSCTMGQSSDSLPSAPSAPLPPVQTGTAFIPTTWIDANGADFSITGRSVAYGMSAWIAVGQDSSGTIKMSTDNAVTWTNIDNQMPGVTNGEGVYGVATDGSANWVAVGNKNTEADAITILYSVDNGATWYTNTDYDSGFNLTNGFTDRGYDVTYKNGLWIAVGHYNVGIGYERVIKIATTMNGIYGPNWVNSPLGNANIPVFGSSNPALCVAYGSGTWCIGGQDYNNPAKGSIVYSTDNGTTWLNPTGTFRGMCQGIATDGNGNWVAVGYKSASDTKPIKYSNDNGRTWVNTPSADANLFSSGESVTYALSSSGTGIWVAVGQGNSQTIIYSTDNGLTWNPAGTNRFTGSGVNVHFANDRWVAVGSGGGNTIKYSTV